MRIRLTAIASAIALVGLISCGQSQPLGSGVSVTPGGGTAGVKTFRICPGPDAQKEAIIAFFDAHEGDTIEFCEGQFDFTNGLTMTGKKGITIKGAGKDKTYLRFVNSGDQDGFNLNRMTGITVQGLTIYDAPGNGLRVFRSDFVTIRDVKVGWSVSDPASPYGNYEAPDANNVAPSSWTANGSYAFYPVICHHVLIEDSISVGSSDAGVYVGQSSDILVRRTEAYHNVAGFEFENTYRAEFVDNFAHDNVGGFLVFDLPGRVQFGEKNLVHDNKSYHNNMKTFAPHGAIVAAVPQGTGILVLDSDQLEVYNNDIQDNWTFGLVVANYGLVDPNYGDPRYDWFPEGMHFYNNVFTDNGYKPELPDPDRSTCHGPNGLPGGADLTLPTGIVDCLSDNATILPTIAVLKNGGRSTQIGWDGGIDKANDCESIPTDRYGVALTDPNPNEPPGERYEKRSDERGRPNLYQFDPTPACKYNKWKFDGSGNLKYPQMGFCVEGNTFNKTRPDMLLVTDYANFHFSTPDPTDPNNLTPADNALPGNCPIVETPLLAQFVPVLGEYVPNPANDPRPSDEQLAAVCGAGSPGHVNTDALAHYTCPKLSDYGLFQDPQDPTRNPSGRGVPFDLNTILFSDYAVKYRFVFIPEGAKAKYEDAQNCDTLNIYNCQTATLGFPVGTVFAKTFAFRTGTTDNVVETRLLIKRAHPDGSVYWTGFAYEWKTAQDGTRFAELKIEGDTANVSWDYDDEDPDARNMDGLHPHYSGTADHYGIPNAGACLLCHGGDDREAGTAPIGLKVRNLNKDHDYGGDIGKRNQLDYMQALGLVDLPSGKAASDLEKMVKFNVPGSGGDAPNSGDDKHKRARAFLEVNCMHCHNSAGAAQNSGLHLNSFDEPMGTGDGICKPPIAAGKAADNADYDIVPGDASASLLPIRLSSTEPGIKMPPVARTVMQKEAVDLIVDWINTTVADHSDPNANTCSGGGIVKRFLPIEFMKPISENLQHGGGG